MKIDDMPAGREMDALVAERVMGWRVDYDSYHHWTKLNALVNDLIFTAPKDIFHGEKTIDNVPNYSTDIAAAWEVVEKMKRDWLQFGISCYCNEPWNIVMVLSQEKYNIVSQSQGETLPLAICQAALKAMEVTS